MQVGATVQVHQLQSASASKHNGKIGVTTSLTGERYGVGLTDGTQLAIKLANLEVVPTPTLGIVIVGESSTGLCRDVLAHILEVRGDILCNRSGGVSGHVAVVAIVGPSGSVHWDAEEQNGRRVAALHGGLSDETLRAAMDDLSTCGGPSLAIPLRPPYPPHLCHRTLYHPTATLEYPIPPNHISPDSSLPYPIPTHPT